MSKEIDQLDQELNLLTANKSSTGSLRFNNGKPEVSQVDPRFIKALADLMTKSAKKYGKFNWALGQEFHTPFDSLQRHLLDFMSGEDNDKESGLSHLIHAAANCMIIWTSLQLGDKSLDTRFDWSRDKTDKVMGKVEITEKDLDLMCEELSNL